MSSETPSPKPTRRRIIIIAALALLLSCSACGICAVASTLLSDRDGASATPAVERSSTTESAAVAATELMEQTAKSTARPALTETIPPQPIPTDRPVVTATTEPVLSPPEPTATGRQSETDTPAADNGIFRELTSEELALRATLDEVLGESNRGLGRKLNLFGPGLAANSIVIGWAADGAESNALIRESMQRDTLTVLRTVMASGLEYEQVGIGSQYLITVEQFDITDEFEVLTVSYQQDTLQSIDWDSITAGEIWSLADLFVINPLFEDTSESKLDATFFVTGNNMSPGDLPEGEPGLTVVAAGPASTFGVVPIVSLTGYSPLQRGEECERRVAPSLPT